MRTCWFIMLTMAAAALAAAEEQAPPQEITVRGRLNVKPANAKEGVAALLTIMGKKGERIEDPKTIYLFAKDAVAVQLAELAQQKARVYITGLVRTDGMDVTKVVEKAAGKKVEKGPAPPADAKAPADPDDDF
jgi:hypothetical protein